MIYYDERGKQHYGMESLPISKATERAIGATLKKLSDHGHTLVPFEMKLSEMDELNSVYVGLTKHSAIPEFKSLESKKNERLMPFYKRFILITIVPNIVRKLIAWILNSCLREPRLAKRVEALFDKNHDGISMLYSRRESWAESFNLKWRALALDALITPSQ